MNEYLQNNLTEVIKIKLRYEKWENFAVSYDHTIKPVKPVIINNDDSDLIKTQKIWNMSVSEFINYVLEQDLCSETELLKKIWYVIKFEM